jgi:hypothetical protein
MVRAESVTSTLVYTYNAQGLRVAQSVDGAETTFTWDLASPLAQVLATSDGKTYLHGLDPSTSLYTESAHQQPRIAGPFEQAVVCYLLGGQGASFHDKLRSLGCLYPENAHLPPRRPY